MSQVEVYLVPREKIHVDNGFAEITGQEAHHLLHVRRGKVGEEVIIINGVGDAWKAEVAKVFPDFAILRLLESYYRWREPSVNVYLGLGVLKGDRFSQAVEFSVQMGVFAISPLLTGYVIASWSAARAERCRRMAVAGAKQCGRGLVPVVEEAKPLHRWCIEREGSHHKLMMVPEGELLPSIEPGEEVALAIGPEGGFSRDEEKWMIGKGFIPICLGPRRLRSETAAVVALAGKVVVLVVRLAA